MFIHGDCLEYLRETHMRYDMIFLDPNDNIGLKYDGFVDKMDDELYYSRLENILNLAMQKSKVIFITYYHEHDLEIKRRLWSLTKARAWRLKNFLWTYKFGQHVESDCGSGFRFLVRLSSPAWRPDTSALRVQSQRQRLGDRRANPDGRVPDNVFEFDCDGVWYEWPRVVGNSPERRSWHPTQLPEGLVSRVILLSGAKTVLDCFAGTGTVSRVCKKLGVECDSVELSDVYYRKLPES